MDCLAAYCPHAAAYDVLMVGDWWWAECIEHTASMRTMLDGSVKAIESHNPNRAGLLAPRDVPTT